MTIKEVYDHMENVDDWCVSVDGVSSPIVLENPAIMSGVAKFHVQKVYPLAEADKITAELALATTIESD